MRLPHKAPAMHALSCAHIVTDVDGSIGVELMISPRICNDLKL